jgi:hypothetical protein
VRAGGEYGGYLYGGGGLYGYGGGVPVEGAVRGGGYVLKWLYDTSTGLL